MFEIIRKLLNSILEKTFGPYVESKIKEEEYQKERGRKFALHLKDVLAEAKHKKYLEEPDDFRHIRGLEIDAEAISKELTDDFYTFLSAWTMYRVETKNLMKRMSPDYDKFIIELKQRIDEAEKKLKAHYKRLMN